MYSSIFFCFVVVINLISSGLGATSDEYYDTEGGLPYSDSNDTESDQNTLYITALSDGYISTDSQDGGMRITITSYATRNTITISDNPLQDASHVSPNGLLHILLMGSDNQNEISYNGRPIHLVARLLDITSYGFHNHNNIYINGTPTQESGTTSSTNGVLRIKMSGSRNVNKITVNGNPIQPGNELLNIQTKGSNCTNEITINGANAQPQSSTTSGAVLNIGITGWNTVNTININDRSIQPGDGLLNITVPERSQSEVRVNGIPWNYRNV